MTPYASREVQLLEYDRDAWIRRWQLSEANYLNMIRRNELLQTQLYAAETALRRLTNPSGAHP